MRYNILEKDETDLDFDVFKPTSVDWSAFDFSNGYRKHIITDSEIMKPYLISYKYFSNVDYEDLILLINGIGDIFKILPGTEIKIPYPEDINAFILKYKK